MAVNEDEVRVIRIYEFRGTRSVVEQQIAMSIASVKRIDKRNGYCIIAAATLGLYPEIMQPKDSQGELEDGK